ncbi:MAG: IS21-like element helper ATPase IstB [Bryobacteraceae bacterium]
MKKILRGHQREETARFIGFRSHWGFAADFCTPGEGHEKGGVEGEGGQFRRNYLVPVPSVQHLEELNLLLAAGSREEQNRVIHGRTQSIGAGMIAEREYLLPLAEEGFDLASLHFPEINASGCAKALTNFYSTPLPMGTSVQVKVYSAYVEVWHQAKCVARHERCYERHKKVLELEHYLDTLTKKPGALAGSTALEQCRAQGRWPASYDRFWGLLKEREGKQAGTRAMIDVLLLSREYGAAPVRQAVEEALELGCSNVGAIRYLLNVHTLEERPTAKPIDIGALSRYDRPQPSLDNYERLRPNWPATEGDQFARLAEEAVKEKQSHLSYLEALLEAEVAERDHRAMARRIQEAHFPAVKTLEEFDFQVVPHISVAVMRNLSEGGYLARKEPVIFLGETGTGKTHLATALAVAACRQHKRVRFTTAAEMVTELIEAKNQLELTRVRNRWTRYDLIVIDELGYVVMPDAAAELLFQVIAGRAERSAVIVTTNLPFSEWTTKFPNARLCKAMLDRLTDQANIIETGDESYRFRRTLAKKGGKA